MSKPGRSSSLPDNYRRSEISPGSEASGIWYNCSNRRGNNWPNAGNRRQASSAVVFSHRFKDFSIEPFNACRQDLDLLDELLQSHPRFTRQSQVTVIAHYGGKADHSDQTGRPDNAQFGKMSP